MSRIRIAKRIHRVEYESLPSICFKYGRFGHLRDTCMLGVVENEEVLAEKSVDEVQATGPKLMDPKKQVRVESEEYEEWIVVERRKRR